LELPLVALGTSIATSEAQIDAVVSMGGQNAGSYTERTSHSRTRIEDTIEQDIVLNRLGSQVEIRTKDVNFQDLHGLLIGGHFEQSSSKSTVTTDLVVHDHTLVLTMSSEGKSYQRMIPFSGELIGPAAVRRLFSKIDTTNQTAEYQTFVSVLGNVAHVTLT